MSDENNKPAKKPRQKRPSVEPGIYPNFDKDGKEDGTYDVKVSRRMWTSDYNPHDQKFRRKRKVHGLVNAQRQKKKFLDELALEALKSEGNDTTWYKARQEYANYLERRYKENSISFSYMDSCLKSLQKHTKIWDTKWLSSFTSDFIEAFITDDKLVKSLEKESIRSILKYIRGVFKKQVASGRLGRNPAMGIMIRSNAVPKEPASMTHDQVIAVINYAKEDNPKIAEICTVAYLCGARSGELWCLKWTDVNFENRTLTISKSYDWKTEKEKSTKGRETRVLPISNSFLEVLMSLRGKYDPYILPHLKDWKNGKLAEKVRGYQLATGIPEDDTTNFHSIRGSFITNLLLDNVPIVKVQSMAGHQDIKTTMLYVRKLGIENRGATDSLTLEPRTKPQPAKPDETNVIAGDFNDKKKIP